MKTLMLVDTDSLAKAWCR